MQLLLKCLGIAGSTGHDGLVVCVLDHIPALPAPPPSARLHDIGELANGIGSARVEAIPFGGNVIVDLGVHEVRHAADKDDTPSCGLHEGQEVACEEGMAQVVDAKLQLESLLGVRQGCKHDTSTIQQNVELRVLFAKCGGKCSDRVKAREIQLHEPGDSGSSGDS